MIKQSHISSDDISKEVLDSAFYVYKQMGVGLMESVYHQCLCSVLKKRGIPFESEKEIHVFMDGEDMGIGFKADIVIDNSLILELKSVDQLNDRHAAQIMNYMRLSGMRTGLLINFNQKMFKDGIKRFVI